jgi:glutamine amidotransferase
MDGKDIAVIDYEVGNLRSVLNALAEAGARPVVVRDPESLRRFDKILLPGVGAFEPGMRALKAFGLVGALNAHVDAGKPLLGICLGMQLLCKRSFEYGEHEGLGWIDADVVPLPDMPDLKVPHIGWNEIAIVKESPIVGTLASGNDVYFNHSYVVQCRDPKACLAKTVHGIEFVSMVSQGSVFGMQFHPEKSQVVGIELLRNFANLGQFAAAA